MIRRPFALLMIACFTALSAAAITTKVAHATHLPGGYYHYTSDSCPNSTTNRVDPITDMFTRDASAWNTRVHINHPTGWELTSLGDPQKFQVQNNCDTMTNQLASCDSCFGNRAHVRYRQSPFLDFTYGTVTMTDPHQEDLARCGLYAKHATDQNGASGSGFDKGRARIYQAFLGTHHTYGGSANWGNTQNMPQRDGTWAASNGIVGFWQVLA